MGLTGALELEAVTQALLMNGADYREFHAAFTGKRPPQWRGPLNGDSTSTRSSASSPAGFARSPGPACLPLLTAGEPGRVNRDLLKAHG